MTIDRYSRFKPRSIPSFICCPNTASRRARTGAMKRPVPRERRRASRRRLTKLHRVSGSRFAKLIVTEPRQAVSDRWAAFIEIIDTSCSSNVPRRRSSSDRVATSWRVGKRRPAGRRKRRHTCASVVTQVERRAGAAPGAYHVASASRRLPLSSGPCDTDPAPLPSISYAWNKMKQNWKFII